MSARAEITPEVVREVERIGFMRPVYKPEADLRRRIREDLRSYGLEGFALLEVMGYELTLSEAPNFVAEGNPRYQAERQTWINLGQALGDQPLGTFFLVQSPREDNVGYFKEVWYAGIKTGEDRAQMYDMRLPLSDDTTPLSPSLYTKIHNRLSKTLFLFPTVQNTDIVKYPVILSPEEGSVERFIDVWADVVYEEESLLLDRNDLKRQLVEQPWKKKQEEIDAQIDEKLVEKLAKSVELGSKEQFINYIMEFELMMASIYGRMPCGSCGQALLNLTSNETKQSYMTNKETSKTLSLLEPEKCSTCKKARPQCICSQAKAKSDLAKAA